jgi:MraZ protein
LKKDSTRCPQLTSPRRSTSTAPTTGDSRRIDGEGRILIPSQLRDSAAVRGEVAVIGQLDHLDVWNDERFREERIESNLLTDADMEELSKLGI